MPAKGYKSVTVSAENHQLAKKLSSQDSTSISSVYERCVEKEYRERMIITDKTPVETITEDMAIGLKSLSLVRGETQDDYQDIQDDVDYFKGKLERYPDNKDWKEKYANSLLELGAFLQKNDKNMDAEEALNQALDVYKELSIEEPVNQEYESKVELLTTVMATGKQIEGLVVKPKLEIVLALNIPGQDPIVISSIEMGDADRLIRAAGELLKYK